ncbi:hypothetical protein NXG27_09860 [Megasphaera paucivorans]|uniref:hypothetical protein n=1 Tax=Megasphaera paucivorans TaxID=349095 RepID=UPI000B858899|nr:hypothetical protein [Megasphaera paucivorans]
MPIVIFINRKGQGLVEYGLILLIVLSIGTGIYTVYQLKGSEHRIYSAITEKLQSILGVGDVFDTGETFTIMESDPLGIKPVTGHKTNLTVGKDTAYTVYWYESRYGQKVYTLYHEGQRYTYYGSPIQGGNDAHVRIEEDGGRTTVFKSGEYYYQITDYGNADTQLTVFTGNTSTIQRQPYYRNVTAYDRS